MSNTSKTGTDERNTGTSGTIFGSSAESRAQREDASLLSSPEVGKGEPLNIYRLVPIAEPGDPRWDNGPYEGEVLVAARTAGDARIVASGRELDYMDIDAAPADDVTTANASAFRSEKLYTVIEVEHGRTDLERGVLAGEISVATIKPSQI